MVGRGEILERENSLENSKQMRLAVQLNRDLTRRKDLTRVKCWLEEDKEMYTSGRRTGHGQVGEKNQISENVS